MEEDEGWLAPGAPRKEDESGWGLAAREEGLENAVKRVLGCVNCFSDMGCGAYWSCGTRGCLPGGRYGRDRPVSVLVLGFLRDVVE